MALIHSTITTNDQSIEAEMVAELAHELGQEQQPDAPMRQPVVFENELAEFDMLHVWVVWEKWRMVSAGARGRVILDAYETVMPAKAQQITLAMGVTTEEATDLGLLPYSIEVDSEASRGFSAEALRTLMREEGAVTLPTGELILRFPSLRFAKAAAERLAERSSANLWTIVKVVPSQHREPAASSFH